MTVELEFMCDVCGRPVADHEGSLYLRFAELHQYREAKREWDATRDRDGLSDIISLLMLPGPAPWWIHHHACEPGESDGYHIGVEQVRMWRDLVGWTAHLMEKNWLPDTTWRVLLGNAANSRDRRIVEPTRGDAA